MDGTASSGFYGSLAKFLAVVPVLLPLSVTVYKFLIADGSKGAVKSSTMSQVMKDSAWES